MSIIYQGRRLSIEKESYPYPDGRLMERVVVKPANAAAILPIEDETCYLIRQFRFAIGEYLYEAPAGTLDMGETSEQAAYRELQEETGLTAGRLIPKGFVYSTPGFTTERIYLYEARDLSSLGNKETEDDELIELAPFSCSELLDMAMNGRIHDAKTICLIHRCLR
ncbi:MAG: NUDIX hydrolase [Methanomicrobiales archaeon]|nr:NUDIX hydrolase [Methanomicrobiales archaeon]